ncbi:hypothetical protein EDB19DRAFT_1963660 [Suillus lakei]|nr:hypothetical protein EDB19DRAFT_1963660 [Suillus lakei]
MSVSPLASCLEGSSPSLYPPELRAMATSDGAPPQTRDEEGGEFNSDKKSLMNEQQWRYRFTVVLDKLEHMPCMMAPTQLVRPPRSRG